MPDTEVVYINMKHIIQDATHPIFDIIQIVVELVSTQNIALHAQAFTYSHWCHHLREKERKYSW